MEAIAHPQADMYGGLIRTESPKEVRSKTSRMVTFYAIRDLTERGVPASRVTLVEKTGLKQSLVDDHVKDLKTDGMIRTLCPGVYCPTDITPDRSVSWTYMTDGRVKLEIGDTTMEMSFLEEALVLGNGLLIGRPGVNADLSENRWVSWTHMPHGRVKLEIGDDCIEVSYREAQWIKGR